MDTLIEVRKEVTSIGSSKAPKETVFWPVSAQAGRVARMLDRSWLYPSEIYDLGQMGFNVVILETVAAVAPDAKFSARTV